MYTRYLLYIICIYIYIYMLLSTSTAYIIGIFTRFVGKMQTWCLLARHGNHGMNASVTKSGHGQHRKFSCFCFSSVQPREALPNSRKFTYFFHHLIFYVINNRLINIFLILMISINLFSFFQYWSH